MRRRIVLILALVVSCVMSAQDFDMLSFQETDIIGTARYTGLAGAMTAVGGDESAVRDNPASLAVFRRSAFTATINQQFDIVSHEVTRDKESAFMLPNASLVFSFGDRDRYSGVVVNNIMLGYQRLKSYNRTASYSGTNSSSLSAMVAEITNNNPYKQFLTVGNDDVYYDENIGWLSAVLAQDMAIVKTDEGVWQQRSVPQKEYLSNLKIEEWGASDLYSLTWGMNISNTFYIGLGANLLSFSYNKQTSYSELIYSTPNDRLDMTTLFKTSYFGIQGTVGAIWHPVMPIRVGLSFVSPTIGTLKVENSTVTNYTYTPTKSYSIDRYTTPMKSTVGLALQLGQRGLITTEYDYTHHFQKAIPDVHTMKAGVEVNFLERLFLRCGYAFEFAPSDYMLYPSYSDTRTDTDFKMNQRIHTGAVGVGFRGDILIAEIAYRYRLTTADQYAFYYQDTPYKLNSQTHAFVITLGWHN